MEKLAYASAKEVFPSLFQCVWCVCVFVRAAFSIFLLKSNKVITTGREWLMAWEDGQRGVYRLTGQQSIGVKRTATLLETDQAMLTDNLVDKTQTHAVGQLMGQAKHLKKDPDMGRAKTLLGIMDGLQMMSAADPSVDPTATSKRADTTSLPLPSIAANAHARAAQKTEDCDEEMSVFERLKNTSTPARAKAAPQPKVPKAAAKKAAAKRAASNDTATTAPTLASTPAPGSEAFSSTADKAAHNKRQRISAVENLDPAIVTGFDRLTEADKAWADEWNDKLKSALRFDPRPNEVDFRNDCADSLKKLTTLISGLKTRQRQLKRRTTENQTAPLEQAQGMETIASVMQDFIKGLNKQSTAVSGEDCKARLSALLADDSYGCFVGKEVYVRVCKSMWYDNLKLQAWNEMVSSTFEFLRTNVSEDDHFTHRSFLLQQTTVTLQKLLRGIVPDKATYLVFNTVVKFYDTNTTAIKLFLYVFL